MIGWAQRVKSGRDLQSMFFFMRQILILIVILNIYIHYQLPNYIICIQWYHSSRNSIHLLIPLPLPLSILSY